MSAKPKLLCKNCGRKTVRLQPIVDIPICRNCWTDGSIKDQYKYITKTRAKSEFRLNEADLSKTSFFEVKNPHYATAAPMKLFLLDHIESVSKSKWGSTEPYIVEFLQFTPDKLNWLLGDTKRLYNMSPKDFQFLIAERLDKMDFNVQLAGDVMSKDGGIDIIATPKQSSFPFLFGVQVKHHRSRISTGQRDIRDLHGAIAGNQSIFNMGMLVTNTHFSADAHWLADQHKKLLRLRDLQDVKRWLKNDFNNPCDWREIPEEVELTKGVIIQVPTPKIIKETRQKIITNTIR